VSSGQAEGLIIHPRPAQLGYPASGEVQGPDPPNKNETVKIRKLRVGINLDASELGTVWGLSRENDCQQLDYLIPKPCQRMRPLDRALACAWVNWSSAMIDPLQG
jgi:hypothetical protein